LIDDGQCKLRIRYKGDFTKIPADSTKVRLSCLLPGTVVSTTDNVEVVFRWSTGGPGDDYLACMYAPGVGSRPAIVKRDGSDGKGVKIVKAPVASHDLDPPSSHDHDPGVPKPARS
jgi:hypothetical protein